MFAFFAAALVSAPFGDVRYEVIDLADRYYQAQFVDAELTKKGIFGTSRVESSKINGHGRKGGDPSYSRKDVVTMIAIYGNKGRRIDPKTIELRYNRLQNTGGPQHVPRPDVSMDSLILEA
ncbi:MAG: hypothetical protein H7Y17_08475, partial [Chlorobia bacterium]|nr:hypothetical protein [Fimbriimonadaceae bacterium]